MKQTLFKATMLLLAIITTASAWAGNIPRPDVNAAYNITGNHGFQTFIPIDDVGT